MPASRTNPTLWITLLFAAALVALVLFLGRSRLPADSEDPQASQQAQPQQQREPSRVEQPAAQPEAQPAVEVTQGRTEPPPAQPATKPAEVPAPLSLFEAAEAGDLDRLRELLAAGADVNAPDAEGRTLLMHAAADGHLDAVFLLLDFGADPSAKDSQGRTAADHGASYPRIVQILSGASAPPAEPDPTK